jgi:uncharacterized protein (DUF934 family)
MPVIKGGKLVGDSFTNVPDGEELPDGAVIVSMGRLEKNRDALLARKWPVGVRLKSAENPEAIANDLPRLSLVALEFPAFRDGRGFSWARILRTRLGFKGEVRAVGHFLYDQLSFMTRVGIDSFEVRQDFRESEFSRALGEISHVYQPSSDGKRTIRELRAAG